jgi:hypothetical protein
VDDLLLRLLFLAGQIKQWAFSRHYHEILKLTLRFWFYNLAQHMPTTPWITLAGPSIIQLPAYAYLSPTAEALGGAHICMPSLLAASAVACSTQPMMTRTEQCQEGDENSMLHDWLRDNPGPQFAIQATIGTPEFQHMVWSCLGALTAQLHQQSGGVSVAVGCELPADHLTVKEPLEKWPTRTSTRWVQ